MEPLYKLTYVPASIWQRLGVICLGYNQSKRTHQGIWYKKYWPSAVLGEVFVNFNCILLNV